ncbi:beta strand repeat-containing protein [Victivallis vadensis]|uniref:beta strand repeat-containing protein n=1 Tax=Victivallis vadensis TaxID=172901 RepID=UPI003D07F9EF
MTVALNETEYVAVVDDVQYKTLAEAVAAAQDGDTVTVLGNISGETVTVDKNLTIVGTRAGEEYVGVLNDVIMNAGAGVTLSVKDLKFGGNSYVSAGSAAALNVEGCYADVTPSRITYRSAFIVTGTSEVSTGLLLTVKNNTIIASKGGNQAGDAYAAAIFGWSYLADGSEISGNTFGSETVPYNFVAVKTINAMAGAVIKVGNNTIYGSNASFGFYAFDFYQNNSRANVYTVLLDGNAVTNTNAGTSENPFVFACVEANTSSFGAGHAQVLITGSNTQDGNVVTLDQLDLTEGQYSYAGTGVTLDADGKITAGDFAGDLAAVLPALAADLFVTSDGVVQPVAAADVSTLYVSGEWAVTPDTVTGTILDDGKYYGINAFSSLNDALAQKTAGTQTITTLSTMEETSDGENVPLLGDLTLDGEKITYSGASLTFLGGDVNATLTVNADMALTTSSGLLGVSYDGRPMTVKINSDVRAYIYYAHTGSTTIVNESGKLFATGEQLLARGTGTTITYNGNAAVGATFEERTLQGGAGYLQLRDGGNIALNNTLFEVTAGQVSVNYSSGTGSRLLLNNTYFNDKGHPDSRNSKFIINAGDGLVQVDNHSSLVFSGSGVGTMTVNGNGSKLEITGNSLVSGYAVTNSGTIDVTDSALSAVSLANTGMVNVSGNSKISAAFTGELSIKDGAVLTTDGLTGRGHLVIEEGATATLSGSGFDFNGHIYGATNKYNQEGVAGFTLNIENAENFSNSALYASNASCYNLMNSKVETTTLNVNATGKVSADKDSSMTVESAHILGALETSGELDVAIFNIYAGFGADDAAGQVSLKNGSLTTVSRDLKIGTANRPDAKYNATATGADEKIAKLDLDNATLKFAAIFGEVPHFYVGSDSFAGLLTATASSIELGENQSVDFKVGTQGTVVLSGTSFTLLRNSAFSNFGAIMADNASTITVNGTITNSGTITMDYTSSLVAASLANSGSINITVDAAMLAAGTGKLIDLTDEAAQLDTANITVNGTAWDSAQKTFTDADGNTYTLVIQGNDLWKTDSSLGAIYVNVAWPADTAFGTEVAPGCRYGLNAFSGLNQAIDEAAEPEKIVIAAGTYDESATQFVKGVEVASEKAVFSNVWSFGVKSDAGQDFDMETAEKFTVTGDLTVGQFYAERNANVYVKIDGNLTTVGSFGAKLATQVDVNGTVTVKPPQNGAAQVMVYGTMNVTGKLDSTSGAMGAVLRVGDGHYETEYGKGGVLNVSGADASVVLRNITGSNIPVTVSAMSSLNLSGGAAFVNENGGLQNLGTVNVDNATLTLSEALENSGTVNFSNTASNFGTIANGGVVNFNGGNTVTGSIIGSADGDVNFNGVLSFEAAAEGEPAVAVRKNGAELMLKAGRDVLASSVEAEDVSVGSTKQGMISGVERLVLQGGSLSVEDLTVYAGSSVTMGVDSSFTFSGAVDIHAAGVTMNGTDAYIYGAGSFMIDQSGREEGKAYKVIDYTGTAVQDYSFVSNLGELENKLIFNNDLYITDKNAEILYVSNSYTGDAGDVTADGNILGYNAFATAKEAFSSANSSGGATIDLQDEVYTYAAPQGTGVELTNAGTYTVINGKGVLLNYELEVNPDKADEEYLLNVEDAHLTLTKLTLRANATMTVTDSRIDYNAFEGGSAYLSVYTNSVLNVSGSTIGFDPRQSKFNDPADLPDAGTGAGAYWNWAPTWNIYGTANIEDSTLFAYVGQANQAGFDVRGNGTATITGSEVSLALLNVGTSYEENKLDPAADKSNLLATLTLDGTTVRNTQYRGDNTTQNGINVGQEDGTSAGKLVIRNSSDIDFTLLSYNDAREIGLSVRNDKSSVEISDSTFKAPSITNNGTILVSGTSTLNIGSVNAASGDAHRIQIAAGTTLKDSVIGGDLRVLGDLTVDGELALGNGGIWCGYGSTQTTATISGGMITAKYAMFQYGTYVISADMTLDYGYLSYGGTFTVNSTIKASGQSGEPFYVRGDVTLADGGKLLIDKALWLDYEGAVLTVADGAAVEAGGLKLIADTSMNVNGGSVKVGNTLENNGTFTVSGASTLNIGKLTGNTLQVVADTTLTDSVIGGNVSVGFNAENAADTTLTLAGDTSIGTLYVGKENRTNDYKFVIAGEETTVKLGSLYSRTGSTMTISNGATLDISDYWQSKGMVTVDASTINHSGYNFYVYNNDSTDTAAIALMNGAVLNHINASSLTLGSTNETVSGVAKGNASVTLEGDSTLNVNRLYLNATGTVEEVAGAEAKTSLTAVNSTVTARGEVGIGAGATVSLGNSAFTANTLISSGAIVMDSLSTITCAGAFTSTGTITARVDAAQSGVSFVQKLINASTLTVNDSLKVEGGREGAQLVATGNALWLDNSDKSTILINSGYAGEVGSAIVGRDGYFFGFNALMEYSTSIGADSAVEFTGGSYRFEDGFSFTGREFTVSGDTSFNKVTGGAVAVTGGTLSIGTVELTADVTALSGALLAFSGSGMADLANLVLTVSDTTAMANRTKYVLATGVKDDSFAVTLNGETYELNVRKDGLLVGVENGELYVQKTDDWFNKAGDSSLTVLPANGYAFGGSDMHESAVMSVERDLNVATNGQNAGARVYGGGLLRNDALFSGTQKCEVTVTAGGVGKGVIGGNRVESGSIGGTLTSSVTIDSADGTFGFIVGGNQLTGGELNGFGGTSVTIQNGTFSMWISGGSVAGGDAAAQVMGNTNVTITGGTFNGTGVFGGGFVQENGTLNQVGNTNVTISGGTFAGNIYGGHGATNKDASPNGVLFGNTNITISGGIFNGNIYGGGFDQSKVQGDTHITFTGTAGADFSVNGIIDGDASNARYWSKGSFVTGDRYLTFDAFTGEFGATLITNIDQMEVTGGSDVNLKNQLDLSEVSQWEFDFGSSLEGFAQNDLAGDTLVLSGWEDQLGDEGWTVMSGSSITGFGEMEVTNGSNLIFAWNADEQYYLGSIGDEQFKLSMEDGAMKLAKLA